MEKLTFKIDWLEFTYLCPESMENLSVWDNFLDEFPEFAERLDEMVLLERGRNGYTHVFAFTDDFTISYNPDEERLGVHVTFPAHGLYFLPEIFGFLPLDDYIGARDLLKLLKDRHCRISRMDIAYDDFTKTFTPYDFLRWKSSDRISTKFKVWGYISSQAREGGTFTLGKRGKDRFLRIYDKSYESNGAIDSIRYEFELRGDWAQSIQDHIICNHCFTVADLLDGMFVIKEEFDTDTDDSTLFSVRKSRADVDEQWQLFLDSIRELCAKGIKGEVKVPTRKFHDSFSKKEEWIDTQVLPTLFMIASVIGFDKLKEKIEVQSSRLKPLQESLLEKYKREFADRCRY